MTRKNPVTTFIIFLFCLLAASGISLTLLPAAAWAEETTGQQVARQTASELSQVTASDLTQYYTSQEKDVFNKYYSKSFEYVKQHIEEIIQNLVDNSNASPGSNDPVSYFAGRITNNKLSLLTALTYLDRMYNFQMGDQNIRDVLMYHPESYGKCTDNLSWLIRLGNSLEYNLAFTASPGLFGSGKIFTKELTNAATLNEFLEESRQKFIPDQTLDEWLIQSSPAYIVEKISSIDPTPGLYTRMWNDSVLRNHILPLLNVSENSIYVIATPATITYGTVDCYVDRALKASDSALYQEKINQFHQTVEKAADQQNEFIELWRRISKPEVKSLLTTNRIVVDSLALFSDDPYAGTGSLWSPESGDQAAVGITEFISPLKMYRSYIQASGEAAGTGIRMFMSRALKDSGLSTYSHELTHLLVGTVLLNQHGIRDGMEAEVYTRGMFETYDSNDPPVFNLNLVYDKSDSTDRFYNAVPSRFQDETDLQEYIRGILDVIYTLDYAEADVVLSKPVSDKQKWFHKLSQTDDTRSRANPGASGSKHKIDVIGELDESEAGELNTIQDLIDHNILAARYEGKGAATTGTFGSNDYYVIPLFSANFASVQNDLGVSGDIMIRRQAFELLAEFGYTDGMVPYISNQYKTDATVNNTLLSDTYILGKIFNGKYNTMTDFKKAMFQKRIDRIDELRPVTISWNGQSTTIDSFDTLRQLMQKAIDDDLLESASGSKVRAQNTQVELLKAAVYKAYLYQTKDFTDSIYKEGEQVLPTGAPTPSPSAPSPTGSAPSPTGTTPAPTESPSAPTESPSAPTESPSAPTESPSAPTESPSTPTESPSAPTEAPSAVPSGTLAPSPTGTVPPKTPDIPPAGHTAVTPNSSITGASEEPTSTPAMEDPAVAGTAKFLPARITAAKTSLTIRWTSVSHADGYMITYAKNNGKVSQIKTVQKNVRKWKHTGLKKGTYYKYRIAAYRMIDGKPVIIARSPFLYAVTAGGKYQNPTKIKITKSPLKLKRGKTGKIKATVISRKTKKYAARVRYTSSDPAIATVTKKGKITAIKKGTCYIYCYAQNGIYKKRKIIVT